MLHPSYFAMVPRTGARLLDFLGGLKDRLPRMEGIVLVGLLSIGLVLTESRMGWITLPLVLVWSLVTAWQDRWTRRLLLSVLVTSMLGGTALAIFSEGVRYRVMELFTPTDPATADAGASAAIRTVVWKAAWDVGNHNLPWGTGTGDVKDELLLRYKEIGAVHAEERKLNAHNQFLQTFAALGLPGLGALLLLMLLAPLLRLFARKDADGGLGLCAGPDRAEFERGIDAGGAGGGDVFAGFLRLGCFAVAPLAGGGELRRHDPFQPTPHRRTHHRRGHRCLAQWLDHHRATHQGVREAPGGLLRSGEGDRAERLDQRLRIGSPLVQHRTRAMR